MQISFVFELFPHIILHDVDAFQQNENLRLKIWSQNELHN